MQNIFMSLKMKCFFDNLNKNYGYTKNYYNWKGSDVMNQTTKIPNRLVDEKSPYLLQHAYNPVNWYPWCEEAFTMAKTKNKPIFLSIGYS